MRNSLVAIGLSQYGISVLNSLFMFYYVKVYINEFHINIWWFGVAQTLFAIWNTLNDPLFGYLQEIRSSWFHNRFLVIKTFSIFLAASFVFMWIPWNKEGEDSEGIHLILSLFLFDAFFSAIGVAWGALFAETTKGNPKNRVKALKISQIAILLSVLAIPFMEYFSASLKNFENFQIAAFGFALISAICLFSVKGNSEMEKEELLIEKNDEEEEENDEKKELNLRQILQNSLQITRQILRQPQFFAIVFTNFLQTARSILHLNFAAIITELLISQDILPSGSLKLSIFFAILIIAPQILLIFALKNERFLAEIGAVRIVKISFLVSISSGFLWYFSANSYFVMAFMLIDCLTVHSIAPLFNIILSDFVDEDARKNHRKSGVASIIFSLNAVFIKPAQSLAPICAVLILNSFGYQKYLETKLATVVLKNAAARILFLTPVILGTAQFWILHWFSGKRGKLARNLDV